MLTFCFEKEIILIIRTLNDEAASVLLKYLFVNLEKV